MYKKIILGGFVIVLCLFLLYWFLNYEQSNQDTEDTTTTFPISNTGNGGVGGGTSGNGNVVDTPKSSLSIKTPSGGVLQVKNFLEDDATVSDPHNEGYYYLGNHYPFEVVENDIIEQPEYTITYIAETQYFNIVLLREPLRTTRKNAEQYLIEQLGVRSEELCQIDYMVGVPYYINQYYSGMNLGFSFCPGSVPL
jgi:hypothetical protein